MFNPKILKYQITKSVQSSFHLEQKYLTLTEVGLMTRVPPWCNFDEAPRFIITISDSTRTLREPSHNAMYFNSHFTINNYCNLVADLYEIMSNFVISSRVHCPAAPNWGRAPPLLSLPASYSDTRAVNRTLRNFKVHRIPEKHSAQQSKSLLVTECLRSRCVPVTQCCHCAATI